MKKDLITIAATISAFGIFIFIKGFQNDMPLNEIISIFVLFSGFLTGSSLICVSLIISIDKILVYIISKFNKNL